MTALIPIPAFIGDYRIVRELGKGTTGIVYEAIEMDNPESRFAIKWMIDENPLPHNPMAAVELIDSINAPNIARVRYIGVFEKHTYFVMDYVAGKTLDVYLAAVKPNIEIVVHLMRQIAVLLAFLHKHGAIVRDLKPSNIMIRDEDGEVVFVDVDFMRRVEREYRQTSLKLRIGTVGYTSPEHHLPYGKLKPSSDVFSFGGNFLRNRKWRDSVP